MKIKDKFAELKEKKEAALIGFITAGYPSIEDTVDVASALIAGGVDILELGMPFSDPIADGPVIQKAGEKSLAGGMNTDVFFETAGKIEGVPKAVMTYYNLVLQRGLEKFVKDCVKTRIDAIIVPDLPMEESEPLHSVCEKHNVELIFFFAPTTPEKRMRDISSKAGGFLYLVSVTGVTGARKELPEGTEDLVSRAKKNSGGVPVAVGFGISAPSQVREIVSMGADAAIVGSAFIKKMEEEKDKKKMLSELRVFASELKKATQP